MTSEGVVGVTQSDARRLFVLITIKLRQPQFFSCWPPFFDESQCKLMGINEIKNSPNIGFVYR